MIVIDVHHNTNPTHRGMPLTSPSKYPHGISKSIEGITGFFGFFTFISSLNFVAKFRVIVVVISGGINLSLKIFVISIPP
jgi:hypothetical protein